MNGLLLTLVLLHGCDSVSTGIALSHGAQELNPALSNRVGWNVTAQSLITTGQVIQLKSMSKEHPKLAKALAWIAIGVEGGIVAANVRTLRQQR